VRQFFKGLLIGAGVLAILLGLVWTGQGTGIFPYPASSYMIHQMAWAYRGLGLLAIGCVVAVMARRL
jgi:hypothetical protein